MILILVAVGAVHKCYFVSPFLLQESGIPHITMQIIEESDIRRNKGWQNM